MYLSEVHIKNFRQFDSDGVKVELLPGLTALVGPNDSGKTTIVDAIRYALSTTDHEYISVRDDDFHIGSGGQVAADFSVVCRFDNLTNEQRAVFLEYLSISENGVPVLYVSYKAERNGGGSRKRWNRSSVRCGKDGEGPQIGVEARELLATAYLRPLRDAERELASGRRSRLSQVLLGVSGIAKGDSYNDEVPPQNSSEVKNLSLEGLVDYLHSLVNGHDAISGATESINSQYLSNLSLIGDELAADISFVSGTTPEARLRHILERLELNLLSPQGGEQRGRYGLGSLNLLYMACELLLTEKETEGAPLLLIEEPEAHLHPQRQLQLASFLVQQTKKEDSPLQVILSTHSSVLASKFQVDNLVLVTKGKVRSLRQDRTQLAPQDYRFLHRFLDATKANLFFARGVLLVEGDAEQILLPTLARLMGRDITEHGVSIVNVGSTAHARYARVFQEKSWGVAGDTESSTAQVDSGVPIAVVRDRDIMPHAAAVALNLVSGEDDEKWLSSRRKWRTDRDPKFLDAKANDRSQEDQFSEGIASLVEEYKRIAGQGVEVFVSDCWTMEYDLCSAGLAKEVYIAAQLAKKDGSIDPLIAPAIQPQAQGTLEDRDTVNPDVLAGMIEALREEFDRAFSGIEGENVAIKVYEEFHFARASKAIAAQYLCEILERRFSDTVDPSREIRHLLPKYLVDSIDYVTGGQQGVNET